MNKDKIKKIADHYGFDHQLLKLQEEVGELSSEILDYIYNYTVLNNDDISAKNLVEEMADTYIMITQMVYLLEASVDFKKMIEFKLNRQLDRMSRHDLGYNPYQE